jgi:TetR/AcrR family transcriptional regulator, cholesterol catabolism regulator
MKVLKKKGDLDRVSETVSSRIKNPDLVRKKHLLIAKEASRLFIKKGYQQTTMRDISKATGMAIGNLYDYISKKEDVLCLVFDVYHQYVQEHLDNKEIFDKADPKALLKSFIHDSLRNVETFRDEIVSMYRESKLLPKKNLQRAMEKEVQQIQILEKILKKGVKQGVFHVQDPYFAACMIFYQLVFSTLRRWTLRGKYSDKTVNRFIEEYILKPYIT